MLTTLPGVDCSPDEFEGAITGSGFPARPDDSQRMDMLASVSAVRLLVAAICWHGGVYHWYVAVRRTP